VLLRRTSDVPGRPPCRL